MTDRLVAATRKGLFAFERGAKGWELANLAFLGEPVSFVSIDPRDGTHYAALNLGHFGVKLHRSADGLQWEEITAPHMPEQPASSVDDPALWNVAMIWSLAPGGADEPGVLWAGTIPGGLFRSADRGDSWSLVRSLWDHPDRELWTGGGYDHPGIHSICVHPDDSRRILVAVSIGGVWETADAGASWEPRTDGMFAVYVPPDLREAPSAQDPHRVVQCQSHSDVLWSQHHNGVFRSTDRGRSWRELRVPPSEFGFATAAHPSDPDTAWFVPAIKDECRVPVDGRLVVARTRDGGEKFDVLRDGLPQSHAYDLVYRHGLAVDDSGDCLALGSTTGGLWISEDGGDHWTSLPSRLPPIAAVLFAR